MNLFADGELPARAALARLLLTEGRGAESGPILGEILDAMDRLGTLRPPEDQE